MGSRRLGQGRVDKLAIGSLVKCVDPVLYNTDGSFKQYIGLLLDISITMCKIQVLETSEILYFPLSVTTRFKEDVS